MPQVATHARGEDHPLGGARRQGEAPDAPAMPAASASPSGGSASPTGAPGGAPWVELGRVARVRSGGRILVDLHSDDPANLLAASRVRLAGDHGDIEFRVASSAPARPGRDGAARAWLDLEGLGESRDWLGAGVEIPESDLAPLPMGEYYWRDLIGLACVTTGGERLGEVREIWETGSNDVLVVEGPRGRVLVPALDEVLAEVDPEARVLRVVLPEGLLEPEPEP